MSEVVQGRPATPSGSTVRRALDAVLQRPWPARLIQAGLAVWLVATAFLWEHSRVQSFVAWAVGGIVVALSLASVKVPPFRMLLALAAAWLLVGTLAFRANLPTLVNNLLCGALLLALCFAPRGEVSLFRRTHRREVTGP